MRKFKSYNNNFVYNFFSSSNQYTNNSNIYKTRFDFVLNIAYYNRYNINIRTFVVEQTIIILYTHVRFSKTTIFPSCDYRVKK